MPENEEVGIVLLMEQALVWYAVITLAIIAILVLNLAASLIAIPRLDTFTPAPRACSAWPRISVLIPARNEAANIGTCLRSILAQDQPNVEILVLDDQSDDDTAAIVTKLANEDSHSRLRLLRGEPLPQGWLGKCHACAQLVQAATGDYLLFTDADTVHGPTSVASALAIAEQRHVGLVSVLPRQVAISRAERWIMPLLPLNILMLLPVALVRRRPEPSLSAGIGQFLFFRRATYEATGEHSAVRDQVLDDVKLARRVKVAGWRMDLVDGGTGVRCRMYPSLDAIWQGFSKNLYDFYGRSPIITMLAVLVRIALFVLPLPLAIVGIVVREPIIVVEFFALAYVGSVVMRLLMASRVGDEGTDLRASWWALIHPAAEAFECATTLNSMRWGARSHLVWKGRIYDSVSV